MKQRIILIIAVLAGIFAAMLTRQYLSNKDREVQAQLDKIKRQYRMVDVLTVVKDLPAGSIIKKEDLGSISVFENQLRSDVILQADWRDIVDRKASNSLVRENPIFWTDIEGGMPGRLGLAADIKPGCRALSINVSGASAVSGMVRPNDHVDVLGTFTFPSDERPGEMELVTMTVIQNVTILATGNKTAKSSIGQQLGSSSSYSTVTLEVTPREAEMLVFAEQMKGRLTLALRNPKDVHYESELPRVDFDKIEAEIEELNLHRQRKLLKNKN